MRRIHQTPRGRLAHGVALRHGQTRWRAGGGDDGGVLTIFAGRNLIPGRLLIVRAIEGKLAITRYRRARRVRAGNLRAHLIAGVHAGIQRLVRRDDGSRAIRSGGGRTIGR